MTSSCRWPTCPNRIMWSPGRVQARLRSEEIDPKEMIWPRWELRGHMRKQVLGSQSSPGRQACLVWVCGGHAAALLGKICWCCWRAVLLREAGPDPAPRDPIQERLGWRPLFPALSRYMFVFPYAIFRWLSRCFCPFQVFQLFPQSWSMVWTLTLGRGFTSLEPHASSGDFRWMCTCVYERDKETEKGPEADLHSLVAREMRG